MSKINFDTFFFQQSQMIQFDKQEHHPYFHYDGSSPCCNFCNTSLEPPKSLYNRVYPVAQYQDEDKVVDMEVIERGDVINIDTTKNVDTVIEKPEIGGNNFLFEVSKVWNNSRQKKINKTKELVGRIEDAKALKPTNLCNQNVLYLPAVGFTRSLSIIQCLTELEKKLEKKLHKHYQVISGNGDSAIIAICLALGMELSDIKDFFINRWAKAYEVSIFDNAIRMLDNLNPFSKQKFGFSVKKARGILLDLLKDNNSREIQKKFYNLKTEVYLLAMYSNKETFAYTKVTAKDLPIIDALMDVCFDPLNFDVVETVKNKGIPILVKDFELPILQQNKDVIITKVDSELPHVDHGNLDHATAKELAPAMKDISDFINRVNTEAHVANFEVKRLKYTCKKLSYNIPKNSTRISAINEAIEAGKAINLTLQ